MGGDNDVTHMAVYAPWEYVMPKLCHPADSAMFPPSYPKNLGFGKDAVHCTPFCTAATTEADLS
jgi:hypothetical protein